MMNDTTDDFIAEELYNILIEDHDNNKIITTILEYIEGFPPKTSVSAINKLYSKIRNEAHELHQKQSTLLLSKLTSIAITMNNNDKIKKILNEGKL